LEANPNPNSHHHHFHSAVGSFVTRVQDCKRIQRWLREEIYVFSDGILVKNTCSSTLGFEPGISNLKKKLLVSVRLGTTALYYRHSQFAFELIQKNWAPAVFWNSVRAWPQKLPGW
jgi:hypothetical protein